MPDSSAYLRFRARIIIALALMTVACLLMATALVLLAQGAVARELVLPST